MNLQDIITYREYQEKESEYNSNKRKNNVSNNLYTPREYENNQQKLSSSRKKEVEVIDGNNLNNDIEKEDKNNSSNYSYTRSNRIEKEIENNINNNNKENINNLNNNDNKEGTGDGDIIDELISKIRTKQDLGIRREVRRKSLSNLDEELKLGLKQLDKIQTKCNKKLNLKSQINFEGSKKYKEVMFEFNKTFNGSKFKGPQYKYGTYYNYKSIKILKPEIYFHKERKKDQSYKYIKRKENPFYLSCIDGKAIIGGERKNPEDNLEYILRGIRTPANKRKEFNNNLKRQRSYSTDKRNINEQNQSFSDFGIRKVNYYNKNYFLEELDRIHDLLFS